MEPSNIFLLIRVITKLPNSEQSYKEKVKAHNLNHTVVYINNCSYKRQGILFKPNKVDRDQIHFFHCAYARYADVLDKNVKTLQSTSKYHKLRSNYDNVVF